MLASAALLLGACERPSSLLMTTPPSSSIRLPVPDRSFRLTLEERATLNPGFDADAIERLLAAVIPDVRPLLLPKFQIATRSDRFSFITKMGDPALQPLLDEVWLPIWAARPEALTDPRESADYWPGLGLARERAGLPRNPKPKP